MRSLPKRLLRRHTTAVAYLALFAALGGSAYAVTLPKNSVGAKQIKQSAVLSKHIKAGTVKRSDLGADAVNSAKVADASLIGADILDGSIGNAELAAGAVGKVPSAAVADRAETADSADSAKLASSLTAPEPFRLVGSPGNPAFQNGCTNRGGPVDAPAAFFRDHQGIVHLRGAVTCPGTGLAAFELPPGYRPPTGTVHVEVSTIGQAPNGIGQVGISGTTGAVVTPNFGGMFRIDGIQFRADS